MIRVITHGLVPILVAILLIFAASANAATLLFEDTFDDMSHVSVGDLDSGRATYSIVASPNGKPGTSMQAHFDGADGANWVHRKHDLGGVMPTSGVATYMWSFIHSGVFDEGKMAFTADAGTYYPMPFALAEVRGGSDKLGILANDGWVIHPGSSEAWGPPASDEWHTIALVVDLDNTTDNAEVYLAQGLGVAPADHWTTISIDTATYPLTQWQHYKYAYGANGAWDVYFDDLAVYSGDAVVPEPATLALLLGGLLTALAIRRR